MPQVAIQVLSIDLENPPGFVEFELVDRAGRVHRFTEKLPVLGIDVKKAPCTAWIDCVLVLSSEEKVLVSTGKLRVDFNELVQDDLVLLSQTDDVTDSDGKAVKLSAGMSVSIYEFNPYEDGALEYLLAEGTVELNDSAENGDWTSAAKWCCRINKNGIEIKLA